MLRGLLLAAACSLIAPGKPCEVCHPAETAAYRKTGMGRSIRPAEEAPPPGSVTHSFSGARFRLRGGRQRVEWKGLDADYEVAWWMGSGRHATGAIVRLGPHLAQSPVTWYSARAAWDMAPGYERHPIPDFNRVLTAECLACHTNAGGDRLEPIGCERCHGGAAAHEASPSRQNIVNPARLPERERAAVCEQCHLSGEIRVRNPGVAWTAFQPGRPLEDFWTVFLAQGGGFKVVSHAEQLARSPCASRSGGRLWCGSCHSPHRSVDQRAVCRSCHVQDHEGSAGDCAACHMPKRKSWDSGHAAFTDHRIRRAAEDEPPDGRSIRDLAAWRQPGGALAIRNLGIARILAGERDRNLDLIEQGYRILTRWPGDPARDAEVSAAIGFALTLKGRHGEAERLLRRAVELEPGNGSYRLKLATAWRNAGESRAAAQVLNEAIAADPWNEPAYHFLAGIEGSPALARYVRLHPRGFAAREALRRVRPER